MKGLLKLSRNGLPSSTTLIVCGLALVGWDAGTPDSLGQLPAPKPGAVATGGTSAQNVSPGDAPSSPAALQGLATKLAEARAKLAAAEALGVAVLTNAPARRLSPGHCDATRLPASAGAASGATVEQRCGVGNDEAPPGRGGSRGAGMGPVR